MTDETWKVVIGAIVVGVINIMNAWYQRAQADAKSDANRAATAAQLAPIAVGVAVTEAHTNSEKTRAQGELATLESENAILREMIAKQDADKALLAQAVASRTRPEPSSLAIGGAAPAESLDRIDDSAQRSLKNIDAATSETAANTRATDRKVDALKDGAK